MDIGAIAKKVTLERSASVAEEHDIKTSRVKTDVVKQMPEQDTFLRRKPQLPDFRCRGKRRDR